MIRLVLTVLLLTTACRAREDLRWTNTPTVPDGAAERLVEDLPPLLAPLGARMASDYLHYMMESEWDGVTDGWGKRHSMRESYDSVAAALREAPRGQRLFVLAEIAYGEGWGWVGSQAEDLAYRRVALMHPAIAADPLDEVEWAAYGFATAPELDDRELIERADALEQELRSLQRRYRGFVPWKTACWRKLDNKERELFTTLNNARGDLRVTTGPLHQLLLAHGVRTRGATLFDERIIVERTCREPMEYGPAPGLPGNASP